jgi:hypothetical protein
MDYAVENWGSFVGIFGLAASVGGLVFAFLARRAAKSAEQAAREARRAITRTLSVVDIGRAMALIGSLKEVHHQRNWDYALGLYPELRRMLSEIGASTPENFTQYGDFINRAIPQITSLENLVGRSRYERENGEPEDIPSLDEALSEIQQSLEMLQSSMMYTDETVSS